MQHIDRIAVIAALLSLATVASAADGKDKKDEGQICTYESVVGSHFPRRVCTSASQRNEDRKNSQERFQHIQDFSNRGVGAAGAAGR